VPLHDIGTVALPDYILMKPGKLDIEERLVMQSHTTLGAETLVDVARQSNFARGFLQMALEICRHHHEHWDGTGYPEGLSGKAIPIGARIIGIVDAFDAITQYRPYREARSISEAVEEMRRERGRQFDPELVDEFVHVIEWDGLG
jgi:HD-GYP domain-containing protein (c-di-GMP phosphodiesterase class II)